jgi:uncharacterized protein with PQ loop repeat
MITILGILANLTSLVLWIPQAKTTYKNRDAPQALIGISTGTQILTALNTSFWCIYGLLIHDFWLPMGTIVVLPLAVGTLILKHRSLKREN